MTTRSFRTTLVLLAVATLWLACPAEQQIVRAQVRWDDPVQIKRQPTKQRRVTTPTPRPRRTPRAARVRTAPAVERAPLLTLQWRLLKFKDDGLQEEISSGATFTPQDKLRLAVKANQSGYLYIVRQESKDAQGRLLFPDKRYNGGKNFVRKDQEFILPSDCSNLDVPCWYTMQPPAGQELFTLVFSRDMIEELPNDASEATPIPAQLLAELKNTSGQKLTRQQGTFNSRYTIWIRNVNTEDNEEIIETLFLNKAANSTTAAIGAP